MNYDQQRPDKAYIWVNIDFDKVKHRIDAVTCQIERVIQKHEFSNMMAALVRNSPELKNRAIKDWIKYGLLCKLWRSIMNTYDLKNNVISENKSSQILLINNQ